MDLQILSQLGEFVGGFGVILSLIYLAIQVRGNTRSQRADMTARLLDRMASMQHTFAFDREANELFTHGIVDPERMDINDRNRFAWLMTEFLSAMEFLMQQHRQGNVDDATLQRWTETMDWWLTFPGIRTYWQARPTPYTEEFTLYIEDRMATVRESFNEERWNSYMLSGKLPPDSD